MSYGQHKHDVPILIVVVQRQIAGPAARDDELSQAVLGRPADEWMVFEDLHSLDDQPDGARRCGGFRLEKEVGESLEVGECPPRIDQLRQDRIRGFGGAGFACARARR